MKMRLKVRSPFGSAFKRAGVGRSAAGLAGACAVLLTLAGCAGGDDDATASAPPVAEGLVGPVPGSADLATAGAARAFAVRRAAYVTPQPAPEPELPPAE